MRWSDTTVNAIQGERSGEKPVHRLFRGLLIASCVCAWSVGTVFPQEKAAASTAQVHVVITDMALRSDSEVPRLKPDEVKVKQGKTFLQVTQLLIGA